MPFEGGKKAQFLYVNKKAVVPVAKVEFNSTNSELLERAQNFVEIRENTMI